MTILQWSFVRNDQPREETARQIALAIREEVQDLEAAGVQAIQIDDPAFREGLPLRAAERARYRDGSTAAFRLATFGVRDETEIHIHMCYSEFNDIVEAIAALNADVISIEAARSSMEVLEAFQRFDYPNEIGPGVYDIHSPRIPATLEIVESLRQAAEVVGRERLWVNPDCGLKTRRFEEVVPALRHMVEAARHREAAEGRQVEAPYSCQQEPDGEHASVARAVDLRSAASDDRPANIRAVASAMSSPTALRTGGMRSTSRSMSGDP